ncbi:unnamed protein product [Cuscuta campestris]|uniref:CRIB domain-containing protein n=1 Tax=Cuscuta campestris TaxID=132261 RepID=A0A484KC38_9ASTE|nr:unnamed protein product [Cuscuta campestris]
MTTKVKGLIKGLRYISQIFDEEKEAEIQIGFPTDVKHVAHIGWDGPSAADNPAWMQGFNGALKSAPLGSPPPADSKDNPEIKWVSEDTRGRGGRSGSREAADGQKSSGRHPSSGENDGGASGSPKSSKPRQSRRHKSAADGTKSAATAASDSSVPDVAKKSRRKKSKDFTADSCSRSSRTSRSAAAPTATAAAASDADQGPSPHAQEQLENC